MRVDSAPAPLITRLSVMSRSPVVASFWFSGGIPSAYVPGGTSMTSAPGSAFVSWIAARSVQSPATVAQAPSPTTASTASLVAADDERDAADRGRSFQPEGRSDHERDGHDCGRCAAATQHSAPASVCRDDTLLDGRSGVVRVGVRPTPQVSTRRMKRQSKQDEENLIHNWLPTRLERRAACAWPSIYAAPQSELHVGRPRLGQSGGGWVPGGSLCLMGLQFARSRRTQYTPAGFRVHEPHSRASFRSSSSTER